MYRCKLTEREQRIKQIDLFGRYIGVRVVEGVKTWQITRNWLELWQLLVEAGLMMKKCLKMRMNHDGRRGCRDTFPCRFD